MASGAGQAIAIRWCTGIGMVFLQTVRLMASCTAWLCAPVTTADKYRDAAPTGVVTGITAICIIEMNRMQWTGKASVKSRVTLGAAVPCTVCGLVFRVGVNTGCPDCKGCNGK